MQYTRFLKRQKVRSLSRSEMAALKNIEGLMLQADDKEEFLLYCDAINLFGILKKDFRIVLCHMDNTEALKRKAIDLNVIKRK